MFVIKKLFLDFVEARNITNDRPIKFQRIILKTCNSFRILLTYIPAFPGAKIHIPMVLFRHLYLLVRLKNTIRFCNKIVKTVFMSWRQFIQNLYRLMKSEKYTISHKIETETLTTLQQNLFSLFTSDYTFLHIFTMHLYRSFSHIIFFYMWEQQNKKSTVFDTIPTILIYKIYTMK